MKGIAPIFIALEFKEKDLERVCNKLIVEHHHFEIVGEGIIILPKYSAKVFKKAFKCKEVGLVPLWSLPRKKANQIRKRHLSPKRKGEVDEARCNI